MSQFTKDLTLLVPTIRVKWWDRLYQSILQSIGKYSFNLILIGPEFYNCQAIHDKRTIFIKSYANPSMAVQLGALISNSNLACWAADDCVFFPNTLEESITFCYNMSKIDGLIMRYYESPGFSGNDTTQPIEYWNFWRHEPLRLLGIPETWKFMMAGMMYLDYFIELGGFDCRYEGVNYCCHDLSMRMQNAGGTLHLSKNTIITCDHDPCQTSQERKPIVDSMYKNDIPLFDSIYSKPYNPNNIKIKYNHWKDLPSIWARRFGDDTQ